MKNKSIVLVVLFFVLVLIVYSIVQVESKSSYINTNEAFDGNRKLGRCLPCPTGLINGDFTNGEHVPGFVPDVGPICSSIVQCSSPINSPYCVKLTPVDVKILQNGRPYGVATYKILVEIIPKSYYFLSAWVKCVPDSSNNCPNNFFKIVFNTKNNEPVELVSPGVVIDRATDSSGNKSISGWKQLAIIFQVPDNVENPIAVILQYIPINGNINSSLLISGISMTRYHPLLNCFPVQQNVNMFLSVLHQNTFSQSSNIWKDCSTHGNNLNMTSAAQDCTNGISLNKNRMTGPCCCDLGICPLYFTIGLNLKSTTLPESGFELVRLFTSLDNNNEIKIIFRKDAVCCCYSQIVIVYLSHEKVFNCGYTNYLANYIIQCDNGSFSVFKDGIICTCVPNQRNVDGKFTLSESERACFFSNKPMLVNPAKCYTDSIIHTFMLFCSPLSNIEISSIYYYFSYLYVKYFDKSTYKCLLNSGCKGTDGDNLSVEFPFPPYGADKIRENARRALLERTQTNIDNAKQLQELRQTLKNGGGGAITQDFTINGTNIGNSSVEEMQNMLTNIVKALNEKGNGGARYDVQKNGGNYNVVKTTNSSGKPQWGKSFE